MSAQPAAKRARNDYSRAAFEALLADDNRLFAKRENAKGVVAYQPRLHGPFRGYKVTADDAKECTLIAFLLKAPETSDVWDHPDACGLADELAKVRRGENPWTVAKGFLACFATNQATVPVEGGFKIYEHGCVNGERLTITKDFISKDALSAVRAQFTDDPSTLESVEGFAAFAENASDGDVLDAKLARALIHTRTLAARAQMQNARGARLRLKAFEEAREKFWRGVGVTDEIIESIDGVESYEDLDKFPELALLGNPDCPAYERCRELIFASQRRGNRGDCDAFKNKVRTHLGRDLIIEVLHARFPDLVAFPDIIEAMADRVHFDHIFSSACAGRCLFWGALHSTVVSTENATRAALLTTAAPLAGDHMMNLLIDFDTLNEHFGARRRLPDFATARARRRGIGREQRRASLASAFHAPSSAQATTRTCPASTRTTASAS